MIPIEVLTRNPDAPCAKPVSRELDAPFEFYRS
jgi:hypothetical protein